MFYFLKKDFTNAASAEYAVHNLIDPNQSVITRFSADKRFEGKTITEIGKLNNESPADALLRIIKESDNDSADATIIECNVRARW